jgi:hypothetical protein
MSSGKGKKSSIEPRRSHPDLRGLEGRGQPMPLGRGLNGSHWPSGCQRWGEGPGTCFESRALPVLGLEAL